MGWRTCRALGGRCFALTQNEKTSTFMSELFDRLTEFESLYVAFRRARRGKRQQESVAGFKRNLEAELFQLQDELRTRTYRPGPYRSFWRTEAKRRLISAAPFRDRVAHQALVVRKASTNGETNNRMKTPRTKYVRGFVRPL